MTHPADIERHPDIAELRERYELAAASPTAQALDGLTMISGLFLALSPWIVGFSALRPITVNNLITGLSVAGLGLGCALLFSRFHGIAWVVPVIGAWTIVAPWAIAGGMATTATIVTNVVVGAVILFLGLGTLGLAGVRAMGMRTRSRWAAHEPPGPQRSWR